MLDWLLIRGYGKSPADGGEPQCLSYGPANHIDFSDAGGVVLGRLTREPARWKRYRGGTAGQLWVDIEGGRTVPATYACG